MRGEPGVAWLLALGLAGCEPLVDPMTAHENRKHDAAMLAYHATYWSPNAKPVSASAPAVAKYLDHVHRRVHPLFTDRFLSWADHQPEGDPIQNRKLSTELELELDAKAGRVLRLGITRTSYVTRFDVGAVASIDRAAPFGPAPPEIVSPNGKVYLRWELRRDEMACSALGLRPFLRLTPAP